MVMTATQLRKDIYKVIDRVARTGIPVEVTRKGVSVRLVSSQKRSRLANLKKRNIFLVPPEDLVDIHWADAWKPYI